MALPRDEFFGIVHAQGLALTFGDVRLATGYSEVTPDKIDDTLSRFSRNVGVNIPLISAAMDTVTEHRMAIALAQLGGLGVIHKAMTPERQAAEVRMVKHHLNGLTGLVPRPICVSVDDTIEQILAMRREKEYEFQSFPVIDADGRLQGIITGDDFLFCGDTTLRASDIMTKAVVTANAGMNAEQAYNLLQQKRRKVMPVVDAERHVVGLYSFSDLRKIVRSETRMYNMDDRGRLRVGAAIGVHDAGIERLERLLDAGVDVVVIDTAHGDSRPVIETLQRIKKDYSIDVVAGNVTEPDSVRHLADAGADGVKIGQGPGGICTTRIVAGIGCPQITAVYQCATVARDYGIPACADGGIEYSGDIPVAIGALADTVMLGGLLAGTTESPGKIELHDGRQWKVYRGMGSMEAMKESAEAGARYSQGKGDLIPEGISGRKPYLGPLEPVVVQLVGGLKRSMGYVGATSIAELQEKARFHRLTGAGVAESHPHGVKITHDAPNYSAR